MISIVGDRAGLVAADHHPISIDVSLTGSACQMLAYPLQAGALPFPVFVLAYAINGVGMAVQVRVSQGSQYLRVHNLTYFPPYQGCSSQRLRREIKGWA